MVGGEAVSAELVARGRLAEMYARHAGDAARLAYLLTGDRSLADDLVQDAFVRLARRLGHLRDPEAFGPYLRRTLVNLANSYFRRRGVERAYLERQRRNVEESIEAPDPGERDEMLRALAALPLRQRTAVVLRYYEDLSELQMADLMRCRPGTVKGLLSKGLHNLRTELTDA